MASCESCMHVAVCSKYQATGGHVRDCGHYAEHKRGRWETRPNPYNPLYAQYFCSACGGWRHGLAFEHEGINYCPDCGADMQTERTEDG